MWWIDIKDDVEGGISHPAEELIYGYIAEHGVQEAVDYIFDKATSNAVAANLIKLLARMKNVDVKSRIKIVKKGLSSESLTVRDATTQAIEEWRDEPLVEILLDHVESVKWLREYMVKIVGELLT